MKQELFYKNVIENLQNKFGQVSIALIQRRCKVSFEEAVRLYKKYVIPPQAMISNFPLQPKKGALLQKYHGKSVSIAFLQKRLNLSAENTQKLLDEWMAADELQQTRKKFDEIRLYVKPPKTKKTEKSLCEIMKEKTIARHIKYLESQGYKVEKI